MKKFDRGRIKVVRRMHVRESSSENWGLDETARRRGGMKVRRMNVSKALRQWMQAQHQWHDPSYRNNDWSTWARIKCVATKTFSIAPSAFPGLGTVSPDDLRRIAKPIPRFHVAKGGTGGVS